VDNASEDLTSELLKEKGYIDCLPPDNIDEPWEKEFEKLNHSGSKAIQIFYLRMHRNTGGGGGFYEGLKRAYEKGYDWLWMMDDDAEPYDNCLQNLFFIINNYRVEAVCPVIVGTDNKIQNKHHKKITFIGAERPAIDNADINMIVNKKEDTITLDANAFVGPLISRNVINAVGYPNRDFYIWGDDTEFTLRIGIKFPILLSLKSIIKHKDIGYSKEGLQKQKWKLYYGVRNKLKILKMHNKRIGLLVYAIRFFLASIVSLLTGDKEIAILKLRGLRDGLFHF
jgi:GT2 family glycosyltransferase